MPRGHLALPKDDAEAIRLFTDQHIIQVRRGKTGRILEVDHVAFGWMKPERFYQLQKVHDLLPLLTKAVEGGYRMKAALWRSTIEVKLFGSGTQIPIGIAIFGAAIGLHGIHKALGRQFESMMDILALFLPFGELWYLYLGAITVPEIANFIHDAQEEARRSGLAYIEALGEAAGIETPPSIRPEDLPVF